MVDQEAQNTPRHPPPHPRGFSRKPDLPKSQKCGPRPPPATPRSPDRQPHGPAVSRPLAVLAQGSGVASETRKQGCGSDCCFGRKFTQGWVGCLADFDLIPLLKSPWSLCVAN